MNSPNLIGLRAFLLAIVLLSPFTAQAYCSKPSVGFMEPSPPSKPHKPYCAINRSCSEWEVKNYQRDMENYVEQLKRYIKQAQEFADTYVADAVKYAKCELRSD